MDDTRANHAERSRGKLMDLTALTFKCIQRSVLCRGEVACNYCHDIAALRWALFEILGVPTIMFSLH
eukprot:scaffold34603_cov158-Skeletonema_dohrnii-CCMP3373.AAC.6